jgi:large subunit ribosomal protein L13
MMKGASSYMARKETVERQWYVIDATGKPIGRLAAVIARILTGKNKPTFTPHVDCGDFVVVINAGKVLLTGRKSERTQYHYYTGHTGGFRATPWGKMLAEKPIALFEHAVKGMLPKTRLKYQSKLKVYVGTEHPHAAQKPVPFEI